ncbi:hypothetical protein P9933_019640 [Klebsiella variicola]|uniref:hypothetical protein n=1 Tax=Klebsiella variicola TaxID=244366 RepID=UPI00254B1E15|nr:hypothetical protein [Klebsiella variicola]MEC5751489.1 hypothetical protein [Klebsiella variicola]
MTDITELTPEAARESGSILIIVAARMARREFFTPLHALCESGKRVVSTRALCDAVERAEERIVSQVPKIVDGHDRLTKKLKEAESRNAELVEVLKKAQTKAIEQGRTSCELFDEVTALRQRIAELGSRTVKLPKPHAHLIWIQAGHAPDDYWDDVAVSHSEKDRCCDGSERYPVYARWEIEEMLTAAGIKVEAE